MTKKSNAAKKTTKKAPKAQQLKIAGTGRLDAIKEIEDQAEVYRQACASRMEQQSVEIEEQDKLTELLKKHGLPEYFYTDDDGEMRRAYIPANEAPRAKVQKVKRVEAPEAD